MATVPRDQLYRASKPMNVRLQGLSNTSLQHKQYIDGFEFISSISTAGGSINDKVANLTPAFQPTSQQIALAATLIVHPQFTIRAKRAEDSRTSDEAYRFLKTVLQSFGPFASGFTEAFVFGSKKSERDGRKTSLLQSPNRSSRESSEDEKSYDKLISKFSNGSSVFVQVEDVWQVVGWAFNCSVAWRNRWERWRLFLDLLLNVYERDMDERWNRFQERPSLLRGSLILKALETADGRTGRRRVFRAIFADGSEKALSEFKEVFNNETKTRKENESDKNRGSLNLDQDKWGDYDAEEEDVLMDDAPDHDQTKETKSSVDTEASRLRAKILRLMIKATRISVDSFIHTVEVYDMMAEFLRPLPFEPFRQLIIDLEMPSNEFIPFLANTMLPFLAAPPSNIDVLNLTPEHFSKHFLPNAANSNSAVDSAKMSFLVEKLLSNLSAESRTAPTPNICDAVVRGIKAREIHAIGDARKRGKGMSVEEEEAKNELRYSGERMMIYLEMWKEKSTRQIMLDSNNSSPLSSVDPIGTPF